MASEAGEQTQETALPREGDVLAGKYRIDRVLGQGGMGVVVAAHHTTLRQKVAVKFLLPDAAKRGDATERFLREARAAVSIQSEHVARVTDVGTLDNGAPYMVMEFLTGSDLSQVLEQRGPLPVTEAVDFVLQACEAIAEAHALGLVHRDLKPANLFLTTRADGSPLVKVLDFGLSKATKPDAMDASLTAAHVVMGSPYYMSPEQIRSFKNIDARADIWSVGVILFQLLTGRCPYDAESLGALFMAIGSDPVPSMREIRPEIPEALEAAIVHCLVKDAKGRTQTIAELARALAPFGDENSHISVERIARVLSDPTPFTRSANRTPSSAPPAAVSGGAVAGGPAPPAPTTPSVTAVSPQGPGKGGSMAALAVSAAAPSVPAPASPPSRGRGGVLVVGGLLAVAAIGLGAMRFAGRGSPGAAPVQAVATTAPAGETLKAAATQAAPPTPPAPSVSVAPALQMSAAAPTATASATAAPLAAGKGLVAPKGTAAPKLSKPVSAALKHEETF